MVYRTYQPTTEPYQQSLSLVYRPMDKSGDTGLASSEEIFYSSLIIMGGVAFVLSILMIALIQKRRKRFLTNEAYERGQMLLSQDDSDFLKTEVGAELKEKLLQGDIKGFKKTLEDSKRKNENEQSLRVGNTFRRISVNAASLFDKKKLAEQDVQLK